MTQAVIQTTVTGMQGRPISTTAPAANQAYTWSGSAWTPTGPFLPLAGGVLTGALRLQYASPVQIFNDTATSITAGGLWREVNGGGNLSFQSNTATAGDFSTANTPLTLNPGGAIQVGTNLNVAGNATINGSIGGNSLSLVVGVTAGSSSFSITSGQTVAINAAGPIVSSSGASTFVQVNPQGGNNTGQVGTSGQAWFQVVALTVTQTSDPRLKKDIAPAPAGALAKVLAIPVKNFHWLAESESEPLHTGWDATDVQASLGNVPAVSVGDDPDQTLGLNTLEMIAWLWQAVQEFAQKANIT